LLISESPGNVQSDFGKVISVTNVSRLDHGQITAAAAYGRRRSYRRVGPTAVPVSAPQLGELNHWFLVSWNTRYWLKEQVISGQIAQNRSPAGSFAIDSRKRSLLHTFSCG
jgi:hypothetical protein